jgi:hypothetical protein
LDSGVIVAEDEVTVEFEATELELLASEELPAVELDEDVEVGVEETIDELELATKEEVVVG